MSAYIVSRGHIAYLVEAGRRWGTGSPAVCRPLQWYGGRSQYAFEGAGGNTPPPRQRNAAEVGQMLWDENIRSIHARYPDTVGNLANAPGITGENYRYRAHSITSSTRLIAPDIAGVVMACRCFAYQACETDDWEQSEAHGYIEALKDRALERLSKDAHWGAPPTWDAYFYADEDDLAEVMGYEGQGEVKQ
jgi:hypothetical protein